MASHNIPDMERDLVTPLDPKAKYARFKEGDSTLIGIHSNYIEDLDHIVGFKATKYGDLPRDRVLYLITIKDRSAFVDYALFMEEKDSLFQVEHVEDSTTQVDQ